MTRSILSRLILVAGAFFLAACWTYAAVGAFKMATGDGHSARQPIHFCEGDR